VAAFVAILAAVGIHGGTQPASTVSTGDPSGAGGTLDGGGAATLDPGTGTPSLNPSPFSRRFSGGGFSATPGSGSGIPNTRSHGS